MNIGLWFSQTSLQSHGEQCEGSMLVHYMQCFDLVMHRVRIMFCNCLSQVQMYCVLKAMSNNYQYLYLCEASFPFDILI